MEQEGLFLFSFGDAGQTKLVAIAKVEPDLHPQGGEKAFESASRGDGFGHHFELLLEANPQAISQEGHESVINIGSSWSTRASVFNQDRGGVDYCSSKAALHALTRATAQDVAPKNIRVNTIAPGAVDTSMHAYHRALLFEFEKYIPLGRIQVAEDLAGAVIFLASNASAYITGQTLHVNGGLLMVD